MGKKSKLKRKYKLNKKRFVRRFCNMCSLCRQGSNPTVCFDLIYKANSKIFVDDIFPDLLAMARVFRTKNKNTFKDLSHEDIVFIYEESVCNANFCGSYGVCSNFNEHAMLKRECIKLFEEQLEGQVRFSAGSNKKQKRKKKKKKPKIEPTPMFFCNERLRMELDAHNIGKQNKDKGSGRVAATDASRAAQSSES